MKASSRLTAWCQAFSPLNSMTQAGRGSRVLLLLPVVLLLGGATLCTPKCCTKAEGMPEQHINVAYHSIIHNDMVIDGLRSLTLAHCTKYSVANVASNSLTARTI